MNEKEKQEEQRLKLLVPTNSGGETGNACCDSAAMEIAICHGSMPDIPLSKKLSQMPPDRNDDVKVGDVSAEISEVSSE